MKSSKNFKFGFDSCFARVKKIDKFNKTRFFCQILSPFRYLIKTNYHAFYLTVVPYFSQKVLVA